MRLFGVGGDYSAALNVNIDGNGRAETDSLPAEKTVRAAMSGVTHTTVKWTQQSRAMTWAT